MRFVWRRAACRPGHGVFRPHMMGTLQQLGLTGALGTAYGCERAPITTRHSSANLCACALRRWDPRNTRPWLIARLLVSGASPGGVLVAHDGDASRRCVVAALRVALPALRRDGYEIVTLSELVAAAEAEAAEEEEGRIESVVDAT